MHERIIERTGGERGILSRGAVESAIERAQWGPFGGSGDISERAALHVRGLVQDHPFADGNKRTAYEASLTFLRRNGRRLRAPPGEVVEFVLAIARNQHSLAGIASWFHARLENVINTARRDGGLMPSDVPPQRKRREMDPETGAAFEETFDENREALERLAKL